MAIVVFDSVVFKTRYAEFADLSNDLLSAYFDEAGAYCNNSQGSFIDNLQVRTLILNALTAHIAALNNAPLVGRISSATEGSVSVSASMASASDGSDWYMQTKYGAAAWNMMAPYRCGLYLAPVPEIITIVPRG